MCFHKLSKNSNLTGHFLGLLHSTVVWPISYQWYLSIPLKISENLRCFRDKSDQQHKMLIKQFPIFSRNNLTKYEVTNHDKNSLRPMKRETCIPDYSMFLFKVFFLTNTYYFMIYQISDVMMSIGTCDGVHFWIYHLNHNSLSHQTWPTDRYKQEHNFHKSFEQFRGLGLSSRSFSV